MDNHKLLLPTVASHLNLWSKVLLHPRQISLHEQPKLMRNVSRCLGHMVDGCDQVLGLKRGQQLPLQVHPRQISLHEQPKLMRNVSYTDYRLLLLVNKLHTHQHGMCISKLHSSTYCFCQQAALVSSFCKSAAYVNEHRTPISNLSHQQATLLPCWQARRE